MSSSSNPTIIHADNLKESSPLLPKPESSSTISTPAEHVLSKTTWKNGILMFIGSVMVFTILTVVTTTSSSTTSSRLAAAWSSKALPFSRVDPADIGIQYVERPDISKPGAAFVELMNHSVPIPLPTNSWYENFLIAADGTVPETNVFQVPYILDTSGYLVGLRTHPCHVQANSRAVMVCHIPHSYSH